jgi:hypothetical protein
MPARAERGGDAFVLVRLNPPQGRTRRPGGPPAGVPAAPDQPAARGAARRGAGGARTSRQPAGPPARVPAAPDQPAPPTPPLTSPRNAGGGIPLAETYPAPRAAANRLTRELQAAPPGCERWRLSGDRCGRSARPQSTTAAPRNHPDIGDSAHSRGSAAAPEPAARQRPAAGGSRVGTGFACRCGAGGRAIFGLPTQRGSAQGYCGRGQSRVRAARGAIVAPYPSR